MLIAGKVSTDPVFIRRWIEEREGWPAIIKDRSRSRRDGRLFIGFQDMQYDGSVVPVSWEVFLQKFDKDRLSFVYDDTGPEGDLSRFYYFL